MKKSIFIIAVAIGMVACNDNKQNVEVEEQVTEETVEVVQVEIPSGAEWKLTELNGESIVLDAEFPAEPYLVFETEGRITGNLGCNGFGGNFEVEANNGLKLEHIAATQMACPNLEVEQEFLEVLNTTRSFNVEGNRLELRNENQEVTAKFTRVE